jgi:geranylgeranyl diphosphate synthase type II
MVRGPAAWVTGTLATRLRAFERYFDRTLPGAEYVPRRLHAAMRYAALSPGKRLRPLLTLAACQAVGGRWQRALPAAAAVECVHAFSLIHDDLPAMDNDDYRRGRLTTHKKFGEALGLLAGDALIALAFQELARLTERGVPAARIVDATRTLAFASGSYLLVGGQVLDLEAEGRRPNPIAIREIHLRKTGALMGAALELGGLVAGTTQARLRRLGEIGLQLGLAFQIHDDLFNRGSSLKRLGKRAGTDAKRGKATYPAAVGEERAREEAAVWTGRALLGVRSFGPRARTLQLLIAAMAARDR